jgi:hypothetical protein
MQAARLAGEVHSSVRAYHETTHRTGVEDGSARSGLIGVAHSHLASPDINYYIRPAMTVRISSSTRSRVRVTKIGPRSMRTASQDIKEIVCPNISTHRIGADVLGFVDDYGEASIAQRF